MRQHPKAIISIDIWFSLIFRLTPSPNLGPVLHNTVWNSAPFLVACRSQNHFVWMSDTSAHRHFGQKTPWLRQVGPKLKTLRPIHTCKTSVPSNFTMFYCILWLKWYNDSKNSNYEWFLNLSKHIGGLSDFPMIPTPAFILWHTLHWRSPGIPPTCHDIKAGVRVGGQLGNKA